MPDEKPNLPPPGAGSDKAGRYIDSLVTLLEKDKITVTQTDLSRFNSVSMEDHYRINLHDYDAEISHNKNPDTGEETFVIIFNSLNKFDMGNPKPLILAYLHLTSEQFIKIKQAADNQLERARKAQEEERFNQTMNPIDQLLTQLSGGDSTTTPASDDLSQILDQTEQEVLSEQQPKKSFDSFPSISEYGQPEEHSDQAPAAETSPTESTSPSDSF